MRSKDWFAFISLGLIWGSSFLWIKIGLQQLQPLTLIALRLGFGLIGMIVVVLIQRPPLPRSSRLWAGLVLLGFTNTALPFFLITWGEQYVASSVTSILNSTVPLFTMIIAHFFLQDERIDFSRVVGLVIGFLGIVLLVGRGIAGGGLSANFLGQIAVLAAAAAYGASNVFARKYMRQVSPIFQSFLIILTAEAIAWLTVPLVDLPLKLPSSSVTWLAVIWLGLLGSCVAYLLYFSLIQSVGSTRAAMVTYTFPVVGVTLGVVFLNESFYLQLLLGAVLVIVGVWIVNSNRRIPVPFRKKVGITGD
jgi:drug/metabolite transporter (DMT)-like permease